MVVTERRASIRASSLRDRVVGGMDSRPLFGSGWCKKSDGELFPFVCWRRSTKWPDVEMDVGDGRVWRRIRFQLEGPLLLNSGSVVFCLGVLGAGGYECWAGVGSTGHLSSEAEGGREFQTPKQRTPVGQTPLAAGTCPFSLVPTGVSCALRVSASLFRLTSSIEQVCPSSPSPH